MAENHPSSNPDASPLTPAQARAKAKAEAAAAKAKAKDDAILAKNAAAIECVRQKDARGRAAAEFAKGWLEEGEDVYASAEGPCGTTLRLQWIRCTRPTVYNLTNSDMGKTLKSIGFEKVSCFDGIDTTWSGLF